MSVQPPVVVATQVNAVRNMDGVEPRLSTAPFAMLFTLLLEPVATLPLHLRSPPPPLREVLAQLCQERRLLILGYLLALHTLPPSLAARPIFVLPATAVEITANVEPRPITAETVMLLER